MADTNYIGGTAASELLKGTSDQNVIWGQGGADTLIGGNGNDLLNSGEYVLPDNSSQPDFMGDWLDGGAGNDQLIGGSGNDFLTGGTGSNSLNGGIGYDTAIFAGKWDEYTIAKKDGLPAAVTQMNGAGSTDTLFLIERLSFSDVSIAYDIGADGNAGRMYRLYQAALNRTPDEQGLGWWIKAADDGNSWIGMAQGFTGSDEWKQLYGAQSTDEAFLANLYRNALHREHDQEGYAFWLQALHDGVSREQLLLEFAESAENQAAVIGAIQGGIEYQLFTGGI